MLTAELTEHLGTVREIYKTANNKYTAVKR